ncbi:hypothetical protein V6N12_002867 [Hibiscus sabdariffa]|uniref:Endonuclease/exonuclease/phosphatase domain-containing protein n=1 Tax=Hibiscus sabdariffa TaxID=183260 RepID=A0ABR2EBR4_9ROSI
MKVLSWNIRGLGSNLKVSALKKLLNSVRVDVAFIQESKKVFLSVGDVSKLWYDDVFDFRYSEAEGIFIPDGFPCLLANVYAPCIASEQKVLWQTILNLKNVKQGKWIIGGDFNAVRSRLERKGCKFKQVISDEFNSFIEASNLVDVPITGKKFTWYGPLNKRSRLDRILLDEGWSLSNQGFSVYALNRSVSDHIPLLLSKEIADFGPTPFKFINTWVHQNGFSDIVKSSFESSNYPSTSLMVRLIRVKRSLKTWNSSSNCNFDKKVMLLENRINFLEQLGDVNNLSVDLLEELKISKLEYWDVLRAKNDLWRQKSRLNWIKTGDANSKFFHKAVKFRKRKNMILGPNIGEAREADPNLLKEKIFEHFKHHFSCKKRTWIADHLQPKTQQSLLFFELANKAS